MDLFVACSPVDRVAESRFVAAEYGVVAVATENRVPTALAKKLVLAKPAIDRVATITTGQHVVTVTAQ